MKQIILFLFIAAFVSHTCGVIAQCIPDSVSYNYTGDTQTFIVPPCVTTITVRAWGAGGGGGGTDCDDGGAGGGGAYSSNVLSVTPNEMIKIVVGGGGAPGANDVAGSGAGLGGFGYGNGGEGGEPGYQHPGGYSGAGGGGGGGTAALNGITPLLVAGGGGGAGGAGCSSDGGVGGGGGQNGFPGTGAGGAAGGGPNNNGVIGSSGIWDCGGGGGGGGGLNGGDSGMVALACDCGAGGGGGGNSLGGLIANGSGSIPGYSIYPGLPAGNAVGGPADAGAGGPGGGNGYLIIEYCQSAGYAASISYTGATCFGDDNGSATVTTVGGTSPFTYSWSPAGGSNATATGLTAGTYKVKVTDSTGCVAVLSVTITQPNAINVVVTSVPPDSACVGQSIILSASGANTYMWSTGVTTSSINAVIPAGDTAYYGVKGIVGSCSDSIPVKIKIIPKLSVSISPANDTICPGKTITINATTTGGQAIYKWSDGESTSSITVNDTITTTYTATVYGICDTMTRIATITVIPLPKPAINGAIYRCSGMNDTLTISSSVNPTKYIWNNGATTTSVITGALNNDTIVYVTAYNSIGCPIKDSLEITVRPAPNVTITPPIIACSGNPVFLKASASGTGPFSYKWSPGGQTIDSITVNPDSITSYSVVVSNDCAVIRTTTVTPDNPTLAACCDHTILSGDDTVLIAYGLSSKPYTWSPSVTCLNPPLCNLVQVSPTVTTTYTVVMTDSSNCQLEKIITIVVEPRCFDFTVPNVFTPTNPGLLGLNNVFYIKALHLDSWSIMVFDRWGKEVYKSADPNQYWDGNTESGDKAPAGVYYYVINGVCQGNTYKKDGFVQLIR